MSREPPFAVEDQIRHALPALAQERVTELAQMVERLVSAFHPDRIYAFGSQVRGEAGPDSDIDLLIVVPHTSEPSHRLAQAAYHALPVHSLPLDILVKDTGLALDLARDAGVPAPVLGLGSQMNRALTRDLAH